MRNPRKKTQKFSREEKLLARQKNVVVDSDGIIVEEKKEAKHKNIGIKLMKKYGIKTAKRGVGITRKNKDQSKTARKISAKSRKMNRGK